MLDSNQTLVKKIALAFAQALVDRNFETAQMLLSGALSEKWSPRRLEEELTEMVAYGEGPPEQAEVISIDDMREWPTRQDSDIGWAYVAICGDGFNEAVSVIVSNEGFQAVIRNIEWGRP
jgi:hypothetical protein